MNIHDLYIALAVCVILEACYYAFNFIVEYKAKKKLETRLRSRKRTFEEYKKKFVSEPECHNDDYTGEILVMFLKQEIMRIRSKLYKRVMTRTINQKSLNNQKSYASKILQESGFLVDVDD